MEARDESVAPHDVQRLDRLEDLAAGDLDVGEPDPTAELLLEILEIWTLEAARARRKRGPLGREEAIGVVEDARCGQHVKAAQLHDPDVHLRDLLARLEEEDIEIVQSEVA